MNIETFREFCLSLPGVSESMPWLEDKNEYNRGLLCFTVADKWFCFVHVDEFTFCNLKCPPERAEDLRARYEGVRPGWHMNKKYWNSVYFHTDVPDSVIYELIKLAYDTVVAGLPRKVKDTLSSHSSNAATAHPLS